jgi:hypothetical protein
MDMDDPLVTFLRHQLAARERICATYGGNIGGNLEKLDTNSSGTDRSDR